MAVCTLPCDRQYKRTIQYYNVYVERKGRERCARTADHTNVFWKSLRMQPELCGYTIPEGYLSLKVREHEA
jgi:hypothetical protein